METRAKWDADKKCYILNDVHVPPENLLPNIEGLSVSLNFKF